MEPADRGRSRSERKRANIICYGKKGHYSHECRSPRKQEKGGRTQNTASTSGSNAHASNGHGGNAPANKLNPSKPSGGSLLCLMEPGEIAYSASADGRAHHYIDTAASSHSLEEIGALYDYVPFEVPRSITMAENDTIQAFGSVTLKFATYTDGKEMKGELHNIYYIHDIRHQLISVGKPYSQGRKPRLSRNGFTLYECLIARATWKNGVYPLTLQTIYSDFGLVAGEADAGVSDEKMHERLEHEDEHPISAFSIWENSDAISVYDWHRRMGRRSMKTIVDMENGAVTGMVLKDVPEHPPKLDSCPSCALGKAQCLPFKTGRTRATMPLELIHGHLVGPMPEESASRCKYGFVLMDDYSRASWVLPLRAKSDVSTEFEIWPRR